MMDQNLEIQIPKSAQSQQIRAVKVFETTQNGILQIIGAYFLGGFEPRIGMIIYALVYIFTLWLFELSNDNMLFFLLKAHLCIIAG